ncbi:uncharacterized protein FPRO_10893 [Fusarium proliferatum ET1]|uniref:Uncharacterized protein n=1 Tax=Fusarium proliferatum (strain ET1) TaxID=1227346 RepID=A0A1L7VLL2_FUSPR|nr:uncharacterized protein FPRO_10893 [Fusarium proliferatum ET1]CZR41304.1 uncharacterized protein FPRO_10893 [Fusarium proliferatum ET1]
MHLNHCFFINITLTAVLRPTLYSRLIGLKRQLERLN